MKRGFTLIEVLVTMAIVSILAGIMVPAVWKFWESQDVQTTRERIKTLKLAMVGDRSLIQNGIRTSYGFVGDNGELPFANSSSSASLSFLVNRPAGAYPHWNGPYMSGFDPAEFRRDAWGNPFSYYLCSSPDNRYLSGALRSGGPNGKLDNAYDQCDTEGTATFCKEDDICIALDRKEVAPTNRIQVKYELPPVLTQFSSARVEVSFKNPNEPSGESVAMSFGCKSKTSGVFPNFSSLNLPIGKITITSKGYKNSNCPGTETFSGTVDYFISDNISTLFISMMLTPKSP